MRILLLQKASACRRRLTTEDCVCSQVMEAIASGERCTQAQDEHGVNAECETHVINTQEALHDEPEGGKKKDIYKCLPCK